MYTSLFPKALLVPVLPIPYSLVVGTVNHHNWTTLGGRLRDASGSWRSRAREGSLSWRPSSPWRAEGPAPAGVHARSRRAAHFGVCGRRQQEGAPRVKKRGTLCVPRFYPRLNREASAVCVPASRSAPGARASKRETGAALGSLIGEKDSL